MPRDDDARSQGAQPFERRRVLHRVRGRAHERDGVHQQVARRDDPLVRQVHHDVPGTVPPAEVKNLDSAPPLPQHEPVIHDPRRRHQLELRRLGQEARAKRRVAAESATFLVAERGAVGPLALA